LQKYKNLTLILKINTENFNLFGDGWKKPRNYDGYKAYWNELQAYGL